VEGVHARIVRQGGGYLLADAGTAAGTFLNDRPVLAPAELRSGDLIRVGRTALLFLEKGRRGG
jgi:pSer/pThr/pTyr-binding forkhead associated (FHA) protein